MASPRYILDTGPLVAFAIPFPLQLDGNHSVAAPIERVTHVWDQLDQEDYSHLAKS